MRLFSYVAVFILAAIVGLSCAASSESGNEPQTVEDASRTSARSAYQDTIDPSNRVETAEPVAAGTQGLATYDESIPDAGYHAYYIYHQDVDALSASSDLVFIGRITDYKESVLTVAFTDMASTPLGVQSDIHDGVVFTVEELIAGELPSNTKEVTMLTHALIVDAAGDPMVRISASPIEVLRSGIEQRNLSDGPRYLVFAIQNDPTGPYYGPNIFSFNTPGSVVRVLNDGILSVGVDMPLNSAKTTEDETAEPVNALTLADIRSAVNVTHENNQSPNTQPQNNEPKNPQETDTAPTQTKTS